MSEETILLLNTNTNDTMQSQRSLTLQTRVFSFLFFFFSFSRALHLTAGLVNASDLLELLLSFNADVDAMNDDLCSPLFYATQSNNLYAASLLLNHGM